MNGQAKPQPASFDRSLARMVEDTLGESSHVGWRIRHTPTGDGRQALVSVCGRFRVLAEKSRHARHGVMFRAERRIESPPGNWTWRHLSSHRTEAAAKAACERAARPPSNKRKPSSRPAP
ncbi:MAG: hypothetical protein DCC68_11500 [Planctomycetota bacterium]|nr:MAG: hypothetical protein DCC68_11500 [Planctomycetota bacterium]